MPYASGMQVPHSPTVHAPAFWRVYFRPRKSTLYRLHGGFPTAAEADAAALKLGRVKTWIVSPEEVCPYFQTIGDESDCPWTLLQDAQDCVIYYDSMLDLDLDRAVALVDLEGHSAYVQARMLRLYPDAEVINYCVTDKLLDQDHGAYWIDDVEPY